MDWSLLLMLPILLQLFSMMQGMFGAGNTTTPPNNSTSDMAWIPAAAGGDPDAALALVEAVTRQRAEQHEYEMQQENQGVVEFITYAGGGLVGGAVVGAGLGLIGGPLAPLTVTAGAIGGAALGFVGGIGLWIADGLSGDW